MAFDIGALNAVLDSLNLPSAIDLIESLDIEARLKHAIAHQQFKMVYQPIIREADNIRSIDGWEALMRWDGPDSVGPSVFFGVAEKTGLTKELTQIALNLVCTEGVELPGWVAVNIPPRHVGDAWLQEDIMSCPLDSSRLKMEITETEDWGGGPALSFVGILALLKDYREQGYKINLDDFGTGFSGLSRMLQLAGALDGIKIDASFVKGLTQEKDSSYAICKAIAAMGKELGLEVIAEGVETQQQLEILQEMGVQLFQGWLFAPGMPLGKAMGFGL